MKKLYIFGMSVLAIIILVESVTLFSQPNYIARWKEPANHDFHFGVRFSCYFYGTLEESYTPPTSTGQLQGLQYSYLPKSSPRIVEFSGLDTSALKANSDGKNLNLHVVVDTGSTVVFTTDIINQEFTQFTIYKNTGVATSFLSSNEIDPKAQIEMAFCQ